MRIAISFLLLSLLTLSIGIQDQKKFGIATYQAPNGWKEEKGDGLISYAKTSGSDFGQIALYEHTKSKGSIQADFDGQWEEIVAKGKEISEPDKTKPTTVNGWTAMSGSGTWKFNGANVATILTVYSNQKVSVSILVNFTAPELARDYVTMLESLSLDASKATTSTPTAPKNTKGNNLVGRNWEGVSLEKYVAGGPNMFHTGGFFSARYKFNADGTYQFYGVLASNIIDGKTFQYESGTYAIAGNQLTISPKQGTTEEWSKKGKTSNGNSEIRNREINETWGKKLKTLPRKLDKVTYTFRVEYLVGNKADTLILEFPKKNAREDTGNMTYYFETPTSRLTPLPPGVK